MAQEYFHTLAGDIRPEHSFELVALLGTGTLVGGLSNPVNERTGTQTFGAGSVVAVPQSAMHSAENPSCTDEVVLQQAQSGGVNALYLQPRTHLEMISYRCYMLVLSLYVCHVQKDAQIASHPYAKVQFNGSRKPCL